MSEMTERVARAIAKEAWGHGLTGETLPWEKIPDVYRAGYRRWAVKAVEAMREPTEAMIDAIPAGPAGPAGREPEQRDVVRSHWSMMIDEALK